MALPPQVTPEDARAVATALWGLDGPLRELGSMEDRNFRIGGAEREAVLKFANATTDPSSLEAQHAALTLLADAGLRVPVPVPSLAGTSIATAAVAGVELRVRALSWVDGTPLLDLGLTRDRCRLLGELAGRTAAALAGFDHDGLLESGSGLWDLRDGADVVRRHADLLAPDLSDRVRAAAATSTAALAPLVDDLPLQAIHGDLTDDNTVWSERHGPGVIDFGDLRRSWRVAELAAAATSVLGKTEDDVRAVLDVVEGFTAQLALTDTELTAAWPLILLRAAVLVAAGAEQGTGDNAYADARVADEVAMLAAAEELDLVELTWLIRGVGQPLGAPRLVGPVPGMRFRTVDLSVTSDVWDDGAWLGGEHRFPPVLATRYGEYRLDHARPRTRRGSQRTLSLAGEIDGQVIQACTLPGTPPRFVTPRAVDVWRRICPDPSPFLSTDIAAPAPDPASLLVRRDAHFAPVQEHYYAAPPQIERGWREFLIDTEANVYVDVINNVATTGHAHPVLTQAAARQWRLLNSNSRFHYAAAVELSERLAALAPEGLDQVFLVNSGSEAVDLALRLATTATGRDRILAAREAYHGWTIGSDAVTSSLGDNPRALETRPDWVELIDAPGKGTLADLDVQLAGLDTDRIAGVILEPIFGNGGGVLLPDGYLAGVFDRVRTLGGVCISDEVQMGYGRLGHHFWGFEQQGATPDVITVAKAMGNGQPLGAVITTRAIAEAFAAEGSFFSSAGGSPVSAAIGLAVLEVMESERLQENARIVGDHFKASLERLRTTYDVIGAVHGMGLYLGVELVLDRDTLAPATELTSLLCEQLLAEGVIIQPTGDFKNVLKIKPPLVITRESVDYVIAALDRVLRRLT